MVQASPSPNPQSTRRAVIELKSKWARVRAYHIVPASKIILLSHVYFFSISSCTPQSTQRYTYAFFANRCISPLWPLHSTAYVLSLGTSPRSTLRAALVTVIVEATTSTLPQPFIHILPSHCAARWMSTSIVNHSEARKFLLVCASAWTNFVDVGILDPLDDI